MRLRRCPKTNPTTDTTPAADAFPATTCGCLRRLVSKVKKQGKLMLYGRGIFIRRRSAAAAAKSNSCCASAAVSPSLTVQYGAKCDGGGSKCYYNYDPLSYSLNFDSRSLLDDEDYFYQFCAFSSRFAAPRPSPPPPPPLVAASH